MRSILSTLLYLLLVTGVLYIALCALLYFRQESFIFLPQQNDPALLREHEVNRIAIRGPAGLLEGWWATNPHATNDTVILYFGGNAEDVLYMATTVPDLAAQRVLVMNYRGYGRSEGRPGQAALYADGLALYDHVVKSGAARPEQIVVMGRSLGSGVATMLASERPVQAVILVTPYDSLASVAARHYPFVPVRWLLRHPFPSAQWAQRTRAATLIIGAEQDVVVPVDHAHRLFDAWVGPKHIHVLAGVGHNDVDQHPAFHTLINGFLAEHSTRLR